MSFNKWFLNEWWDYDSPKIVEVQPEENKKEPKRKKKKVQKYVNRRIARVSR